MVEHVEERGGERKRGRDVHAVGTEREREPEADEDDADVLDRMIGEQPLEIVLHERIEHAERRGDAAEREHHESAPRSRRADEIEYDAHEAVDADLGHDSGEQRRDVARRRRMRERQPDMERHEPGLRPGAHEHEDHGEAGGERRRSRCAHGREGVTAVRPCQKAEGEQQRKCAKTRHHQIDVGGAHVGGIAVMREHDRPRRERHQLPGQQKNEGVVGEQHEIHRGEEGRIERQHPHGRLLVPAVADGVEARGRAAEIDHREEEGGERIDAEMGAVQDR